MLMIPRTSARTRFADWPMASKSIIGFWLFYAATVVARAFLGSDPLTTVENKLFVIVVGMLLTLLIYVAIAGLAVGSSIRRRAVIAVAASVVASCLMAAALLSFEDHMRPSREQFRFQAREGVMVVEQGRHVRIERSAAEPLVLTMPKLAQLDANQRFRYGADAAVIWLFFFLAWSAFYLATQAQSVALGAQRRAAEAEGAAQAAQLRALRYQVNPHFLFNTLNSLSSLIMTGRAEEAESMVLKLSNFFRQSLTLDTAADISLAEEIALQRLYLDIERVRFPRRLKVDVNVPENLEKARLPALILQPLVENAIKHAVSTSRDTVTLSISAREAGPGRFAIEVANRGGRPLANKSGDVSGTGVGIANVRQRLSARFGSIASCTFGPTEDGGYRVELLLPLDFYD
jgi:two-component system LytT family sensor kinase